VSRRAGLVALAILAACGGCTTTSSPTRVEDTKELRALQARAAYERGTRAVEQQQLGLALVAFQEAVQLDASSAVYADAMGSLLVHIRQTEGALAWLDRAVQLDPSYGDAHERLHQALAQAARFDDAVAAYRRALTLPTLTVPDLAHQNLGYALFALASNNLGISSLRFALNIDSAAPLENEPQRAARAQTHLNLGLVLAAEGRTEEAKAELRRARDLAPASKPARDAAEQLKALGE